MAEELNGPDDFKSRPHAAFKRIRPQHLGIFNECTVILQWDICVPFDIRNVRNYLMAFRLFDDTGLSLVKTNHLQFTVLEFN